MKVIVSESLGLEYAWDVISSCDQNGMQAIADNQNNEILFYDPKNRQYCTNKDLMNADYSIHDVFTDKSARNQVMKPTSGQGFEEFATKWDALQKSDDQDVIKTKNCSVIRFGAHESGKSRIVGNRKPRKEFMDNKVEKFRRKWKKLDDYEDDFGNHVNDAEAQVSEEYDDPRDWSASEGEVEIMWKTDFEEFGIEPGDTSTYLIDYDMAETHEQLIDEISRMIEEEYPDLDFIPEDFEITNEDEFWEQRGGNPGKWDDDDLYLESSGTFEAKVEYIEDSINANIKKGEKFTVPVDIVDAAEACLDKDELKWYFRRIFISYVIKSGLKEKREAAWIHPDSYRIVNWDELVAAVGDAGDWADTGLDIPDEATLDEGMKIYHKMYNAYDKGDLKYDEFQTMRDELVDAVVAGLLKQSSIEELGEEWFKDYGTANGWGWQTSFKYNVASALHRIHIKKHPDEHRSLPQRNNWRGWHEDRCSCGLCSSSDSSD